MGNTPQAPSPLVAGELMASQGLPGKRRLGLAPGFLWTLPQVPFAFAGFARHLFTGMSHRHRGTNPESDESSQGALRSQGPHTPPAHRSPDILGVPDAPGDSSRQGCDADAAVWLALFTGQETEAHRGEGPAETNPVLWP